MLVDAPAKCLHLDECMAICKDFKPNIAVIDTSTPSIYSDLDFARKLKQILPDTKTCLVGTHASIFATDIIEQNEFIDFVARHEYDYTLRKLAPKIFTPSEYEVILGITFKMDGKVISNPDRPYIDNLDDLPFVSKVYKTHLNIRDYFYAHVSFPTISIFSSRGCPAKCFYCMYSQVMFGKSYRKRSARNLFEECEYIAENFPEVKEILIDDDNFAVDEINVQEFCNLMIGSKNRLKWVVQVRVTLRFETMVLMKKAGCKLLVAGFESGSQEILDNMKKGITLEQSVAFDRNAKKAGLRVHGCFMVGNPGETFATMEKTLQFAKRLHLDTVQFFPLMVYPGTEAYEWAVSNSYLKANKFRDWLSVDGMHNCVLSTGKITSEKLVDFCNYARKSFYLRPSYILRKGIQALFNKDDFIRTFKAFNTFRKYLFK